MSHADTRIAITQRFATQWAASAYSAIPVVYENQKFATADTYVVLSIIDTGSDPADLSAGYTRYTGTIQVDIVVPENSGSHTARQMADVVAGVFRREQFSYGSSGTINCRTENVRATPAPTGKYRLSVRITYYRDAAL